MKNKRGISPVVATVLIIMITIAAVAALYGVIVPFVKDALTKSSECMGYMEFYTFDESGYNCYEDIDGSRLYAFSIKTKFNEELASESDSLKIVLTRKDATSTQFEIKDDEQKEDVWIMGEQGGILRVPGAGSIISYVYSTTEEFERAELYPVLLSGRICGNEKDSIQLRECGEYRKIS